MPERPMAEAEPGRCRFYFDFGSPYAYLSAERISGLFAEAGLEQPEWVPVENRALLKASGRTPWPKGPEKAERMAEIERRAADYGLPFVWPDPWPADRTFALRTATYAKQTGRAVSFALAAFRQAFAAGNPISEQDNVLLAAAACELHPKAVLKAVETKAVQDGLAEASATAVALGVPGNPTVVVGEEVFWGDDRLEEAVEAAS